MTRDKLLDELHKWQATSVDNRFRNTKPEALFTPAFLPEYEKYHSNIWRRILRLHGTIISLETLSDFPFEHFYSPGDSEFWHQVIENFLDISVLLLCGLITDTGKQCLTLNRLRNKLATEKVWLNKSDQADYRQAIKSIRFNCTHREIASRVTKLRDSSIAHTLAVDLSPEEQRRNNIGASLDEIRIHFDAAQRLFGTPGFGSSYVTVIADYMPTTQRGGMTSSSLDRVLDAIAKTSYFVNEPEKNAQWWGELRKHLSAEALERPNYFSSAQITDRVRHTCP